MLFHTIGCHILPYSKTHHWRIISFSIFSYLLRYKTKLNSCQSTWELRKEWSYISCWLPSCSSYGKCYTVPCYLHHTRMWMSSMTDFLVQFSSITQSCPPLRPRGLQHARFPCTSTPRDYSDSCTSSQWCHPTVSCVLSLLLSHSIFPSIRVFSNESVLGIRCPKN